ncbi:MAG: VirK family protein [Gammaproteobacteria bacterium]|nr:VirK family protein [Gammaproteobacteria bacterium]
MKKLTAILACTFLVPAYAQELKSFPEIYQSLRHGHPIKVVVDSDACDPMPGIEHIVAVTTVKKALLRPEYLRFTDSFISANNAKYADKTVLENVSYKLSNDNQLQVTIKYLNLPDYAVLDSYNTVCPLETAVKVYSPKMMLRLPKHPKHPKPPRLVVDPQ